MGKTSGIQVDYSVSTRAWSRGYSEGYAKGHEEAAKLVQEMGGRFPLPRFERARDNEPLKNLKAREKRILEGARKTGWAEAHLSAAIAIGGNIGIALYERVMEKAPKSAQVTVQLECAKVLGLKT